MKKSFSVILAIIFLVSMLYLPTIASETPEDKLSVSILTETPKPQQRIIVRPQNDQSSQLLIQQQNIKLSQPSLNEHGVPPPGGIIIDASAPTITRQTPSPPQNLTYVVDSTGNALEWVISKGSGPGSSAYADIYRNGALVSSENYPPDSTYSYNIDGLSPGVYNYTIIANNSFGLTDTDTVWVTVLTSVPQIIQSPNDTLIDELIGEVTLVWEAQDSSPDVYELYNNSVLVDSGSWSNGVPISIEVGNLTLGTSLNFTILFNDTGNTPTTDMVWVNATDLASPLLIEEPSSPVTITEDSTGNYLYWNTTDKRPDQYEIRRDGLLVKSGSWNNNDRQNISVDGLSLGTYSYNYTAIDTYGNQISSIITVNVEDLTTPVLVYDSGDVSFQLGETGYSLEWNATDKNADSYVVYTDDVSGGSFSWTSGVAVSVSLDGLIAAVYNYTIVFTDINGNVVTDTNWVTVTEDTAPIFTSTPSNVTIEEQTGQTTLSWIGSDTYPDVYSIYRNGTLVAFNIWASGSTINYYVIGLVLGVYNYTIVLNDTTGNQIAHTVFVTSQDTVIPSFVSIPDDVTYPTGSTGNFVEWVVSDVNPNLYTIERDGVPFQADNWILVNLIQINVDGLVDGTYTYTIYVNDTTGNEAIDSVIVQVSSSPVFTSVPDDFSFSNDTSGNQVEWSVTDFNPDYYIIYQNDSAVKQGSWTNPETLFYNLDSLAIGLYNFSVFVNDTNGGYITDQVYVTVTDIPVLQNLTNNSPYSEGDSNLLIEWIITDSNPNNYTIYKKNNDSMVEEVLKQGVWTSGGSINATLDDFLKGTYILTLIVEDFSDNQLANVTAVIFIDEDAPQVPSPPSDDSYNEGITGNSITWIAIDPYPFVYRVYNNSNLYIPSTVWLNDTPVMVDVDGLIRGVYDFTIVFEDESGNKINSTVSITVVDVISPQLDSPISYSYGELETGNIITWTATDLHAANYTVYQNGSVHNGLLEVLWTTGIPIDVNVDGLSAGLHNFTIEVQDDSGNTANHTVWITVQNISPVLVYGVAEVFVPEGDDTKFIQWNFTDFSPDTFVIFQTFMESEMQVSSGSWNNSEFITENLVGLVLGIYNYTIVVNDTTGLEFVDTVLVIVQEFDEPTITVTPSVNPSYSELDRPISLTWQAYDAYNDTYTIFVNNSEIHTGSWNNNTDITYLFGLYAGNYNVSIRIFDVSGNYAESWVIIILIDNILPAVVSSPSDDTVSEGSAYDLVWRFSDYHPTIYNITNNVTDDFQTADWGNGTDIVYSLSSFDKGSYNFTISALDKYGNQIDDWVIITIEDDISPIILTLQVERLEDLDSYPPNTYPEGATPIFLTWNGTDKWEGYYEFYINNTLIDLEDVNIGNDQWITDGLQVLRIDNLDLDRGFYEMTIIAFDESGLSDTQSIIVQVLDEVIPVLTQGISNQILIEDGTISNLVWIATDSHPDSYTIYQNGSSIFTTNWSSGTVNNLDLSGLAKGYYVYQIRIYDDSRNMFTIDFTVTVVDETDPIITHAGPDTQEYIEGTGTFLTNWTITEKYPEKYELYVDGELSQSGSITGSNLQLDLGDLSWRGEELGAYEVELQIFDVSGNSVSDTFTVQVMDESSPYFTFVPGGETIDSPIVFNKGVSIMTVQWAVEDRHLASYRWLRDGVEIDTDPLDQNNIQINLEPHLNIRDTPYNITLIVLDESNNRLRTSIFIVVKDIDSTLSQRPSITIIEEVYEGDVETIEIQWSDIIGNVISNATLEVLFYQGSTPVGGAEYTSNSQGIFAVTLDYTGFEPDIYEWRFNFTKSGYISQSTRRPTVLLPHNYVITVNVGTGGELVRGEPFLIAAIVEYDNPIPSSTLGLSSTQLSYTSRTGFANGVTVDFVVIYETFDNGTIRKTQSIESNNGGSAVLRIEADETINIKEIIDIIVNIPQSDGNLPITRSVSQNNFPDVIDPPLFFQDFIEEYIEPYLIFLIPIFLVILVVGTLISRQQTIRRREINRLMQNLNVAEAELNGLRSIQAIVIQTKSGIPLYERQIHDFGVDSVLISGLSTAISSFLSELDKDVHFGFEILERESISITSHTGNTSSLILVSAKRMPLTLLDQIKRSHTRIETTFESTLTGGERGFDLIPDKDIAEVFSQSKFKVELLNQLKLDISNVKKALRISAISRLMRMKLKLLLEFHEEKGEEPFFLGELVQWLTEKDVSFDLIARMIVLLYLRDAFQSTILIEENQE